MAAGLTDHVWTLEELVQVIDERTPRRPSRGRSRARKSKRPRLCRAGLACYTPKDHGEREATPGATEAEAGAETATEAGAETAERRWRSADQPRETD